MSIVQGMERAEENVLDKYRIDGIDPVLSTKVCLALRHKWIELDDSNISISRMASYFKADKELLIYIIRWYESHHIDLTFTIND